MGNTLLVENCAAFASQAIESSSVKEFKSTKIFTPMDLSVDGSMENVCKEVFSRLDSRKFSFFAFSSKEDYSVTHAHLIKVSKWSTPETPNSVRAAGKLLCYLSHFSSVPPSILNTISMPQHVVFRQFRRKDAHVHTFHGVPIMSWSAYLSGKILSKNADVVISVSKYCARLVKYCYNVDSRIIYNGVDTKFFAPQDHYNNRLRILFVGRYRRIKRPWYVIKLAKEFPQCDFVLYGLDYPLGPMLRDLSRNLTNVKINSFLPHEEMRDVYTNSDLFLDPSVFEGFSLAMLEAAASGLPLLCSNAASFPEFVEHGTEGLLFNNYKEARESLSYLIEDENMRKVFSRNARRKAMAFDWSVAAEYYSSLYTELSQKI